MLKTNTMIKREELANISHQVARAARLHTREEVRAVVVTLPVEVQLAHIKTLTATNIDNKTTTTHHSSIAGEARTKNTKNREITQEGKLRLEIVVYNQPPLILFLRNFMVIQIIPFAENN